MLIEEKELNKRLKQSLTINVDEVSKCLHELADIKEQWNREEGFTEFRNLQINTNEAVSLNRIADLLKELQEFKA
jgi:hypothetical protein